MTYLMQLLNTKRTILPVMFNFKQTSFAMLAYLQPMEEPFSFEVRFEKPYQ
jgi:hypothetical protein